MYLNDLFFFLIQAVFVLTVIVILLSFFIERVHGNGYTVSEWLTDSYAILKTPNCWIRVGTYSKEWDMELNSLMDRFYFKPSASDTGYAYTIELGNAEVWIANHPYSSFSRWPQRGTGDDKDLPSRRTVLRAHRKLTKDLARYKAL